MLHIMVVAIIMSTNWDTCCTSQLEIIGWIPIGVLCIFLRKYSFDVLWVCGGLQNWYQFIKRIRVYTGFLVLRL
jgi:hypothetical protein